MRSGSGRRSARRAKRPNDRKAEDSMLKTSWLCRAALIASIAGGIAADAGAQENIPNFTSITSGWLLQGGIDFRPVEGKQPPIAHDPAYPPTGPGNQRGVMERMGDAENANLTDWAKGI